MLPTALDARKGSMVGSGAEGTVERGAFDVRLDGLYTLVET